MEENRTDSSALPNTGKLSILKDEKESENCANLRGHQAVYFHGNIEMDTLGKKLDYSLSWFKFRNRSRCTISDLIIYCHPAVPSSGIFTC